MSVSRALLLVVIPAVAIVPPVPAAAQSPARIRLTAPPGQSLLVHGEYPPVQSSCVDPFQPLLHARYRGTIEIERASDGSLRLIGELSFEDYIRGIAEVPRDWPMAALKAQVVAARTYALNRYQFGETSGDWDLCATTECQVYVGMQVEAGPWGDRWVRAVQDTAGQVLLYRGEPAITYYSSTSPGRTFDVEDRFGGEALPYLRGIDEEDDGASPLARWRVEVPFDDLARFLSAEGLWSGGAISGIAPGAAGIRITGADRVTLSRDTLRDALNDSASCLAPDRYPTSEADGYQLPQTVPSVWYRAGQEGHSLVLAGRGWGHGVGMVQWGAYGKAKRGLPYDDILAAYYGGLRPHAVDVPGTIRILIAEGLRRITVAPSASVETNPAVDPGPPWRITGGSRVRIRHSGPPPPALEISGVHMPERITSDQSFAVRLTASEDVGVDLQLVQDGESLATGPRPFEAGPIRFQETIGTDLTGRYEARIVATDGVDTVVTGPIPIVVQAAGTQSPAPTEVPTAAAPTPPPDQPGSIPIAIVAVGTVVLAVIVVLALTVRRRRGLHRA